MIMQSNKRSQLIKLNKKREELRLKLRDHFSQPLSQRNYKEFESVVDELDVVRKKIHGLKGQITIIVLFFLLLPLSAYAQNRQTIDTGGLRGEELVSVAIHPENPSIIFVGTGKGLYKKNMADKTIWSLVKGLPPGGCRVNQILLKESLKEGYIATDKGLYSLKLEPPGCEPMFTKSDVLERDCLSVSVLNDGSVFVGTKGGLFVKNKQGEWVKIGSPFANEDIIYLYGQDNIVYVAVRSGVYKSDDAGEDWEKIFNAYSYSEATENSDDDSASQESEEEESSPVKYLTGIQGNSSILYLVTTYGIFMTEDAGKNWSRLPLAGLDLADLRYLLVTPSAKKVFVVAKSGVYKLKKDTWQPFASAYDCRQMAQIGSAIILITSRDIFQYSYSDEKDDNSEARSCEEIMNMFANEPAIGEVQKMAIEYGEVSDKKIKDWRKRASLKAFMPELSLDYDKSVTTALGASYDRVQVGPRDWGVSLKWELSELIYNPDQTSIDTRSKLMVQLRNDILAEATRIYFERRKLQIDILSKKSLSPEAELEKKLRLMELTALLDRLTGGYFSKDSK